MIKYIFLTIILLICSMLVMSFSTKTNKVLQIIDLPEEIGAAQPGDTLVVYNTNNRLFIRFFNKTDEITNTNYLFIVK